MKKTLIVGAGPIGLFLALKLQQKGWEVEVVEKEKRLPQKACSGLITSRLFYFLPEAKEIVQSSFNFLLIHFPQKTIKLSLNPSLYRFERSQLEELLFGLIRKAKVKITFGKKIEKNPKGYFRVIFCDGANSIARKNYLRSSNNRVGIQYFIEEKNNIFDIEVWPFIGKQKGFIWQIPFQNGIEYGIIGSPQDSFKILYNFLKKKGIKPQIQNFRSALIPNQIFIPKSAYVTTCGDAAGFTTPTSGGGIIWGMKAVEFLVNAFPDFSRYRKEALQFFLPKFYLGRIGKEIAYYFGFNKFLSIFLPSRITFDTNLFNPFWKYSFRWGAPNWQGTALEKRLPLMRDCGFESHPHRKY